MSRCESARADPHWLTCQAAQPSRATVYQPLSITWADPGGTPADNGTDAIRMNRAGLIGQVIEQVDRQVGRAADLAVLMLPG